MNESANNKWQAWYAAFDETYGAPQRYEWYSQAATAYRWARPRYPEALINKVLNQAGLSKPNAAPTLKPNAVLEIGCGPGIATSALAAKGLHIVGLEPSAAACELARKSCQENPNVTIINSTFEDYPLQRQTFDAVIAATSFHWISPTLACQKSAAALKPGGSLILLWATPPQPSEELCHYLQPIYDRYALTELGKEQHHSQAYYQKNFETFANTLGQSGYFQTTAVEIEQQQSTYSIEKYLALLTTLSPYIDLPEQTQDDLLTEIGQALAKRLETGALEATHWFASQVAPLQSSHSASG